MSDPKVPEDKGQAPQSAKDILAEMRPARKPEEEREQDLFSTLLDDEGGAPAEGSKVLSLEGTKSGAESFDSLLDDEDDADTSSAGGAHPVERPSILEDVPHGDVPQGLDALLEDADEDSDSGAAEVSAEPLAPAESEDRLLESDLGEQPDEVRAASHEEPVDESPEPSSVEASEDIGDGDSVHGSPTFGEDSPHQADRADEQVARPTPSDDRDGDSDVQDPSSEAREDLESRAPMTRQESYSEEGPAAAHEAEPNAPRQAASNRAPEQSPQLIDAPAAVAVAAALVVPPAQGKPKKAASLLAMLKTGKASKKPRKSVVGNGRSPSAEPSGSRQPVATASTKKAGIDTKAMKRIAAELIASPGWMLVIVCAVATAVGAGYLWQREAERPGSEIVTSARNELNQARVRLLSLDSEPNMPSLSREWDKVTLMLRGCGLSIRTRSPSESSDGGLSTSAPSWRGDAVGQTRAALACAWMATQIAEVNIYEVTLNSNSATVRFAIYGTLEESTNEAP